MQRLEVSGAVRPLWKSLGVEGLHRAVQYFTMYVMCYGINGAGFGKNELCV